MNRAEVRKAMGLCVRGCGNRARPGKTMCAPCAAETSERQIATQHAHVQKGLCRLGCGREALPGKVRCLKCEADHRNRESIRNVSKTNERYKSEIESWQGLRKEDLWRIQNLSPAK